LLVAVLHTPGTVFKEIAAGNTRVIGAVQRLTFLFILMPPIFFLDWFNVFWLAPGLK